MNEDNTKEGRKHYWIWKAVSCVVGVSGTALILTYLPVGWFAIVVIVLFALFCNKFDKLLKKG